MVQRRGPGLHVRHHVPPVQQLACRDTLRHQHQRRAARGGGRYDVEMRLDQSRKTGAGSSCMNARPKENQNC